jgi:hypothetical protein
VEGATDAAVATDADGEAEAAGIVEADVVVDAGGANDVGDAEEDAGAAAEAGGGVARVRPGGVSGGRVMSWDAPLSAPAATVGLALAVGPATVVELLGVVEADLSVVSC